MYVVIEVGFLQATYSVSEAAEMFTDVMYGILEPLDPLNQLAVGAVVGVTVTVIDDSAVGKIGQTQEGAGRINSSIVQKISTSQ